MGFWLDSLGLEGSDIHPMFKSFYCGMGPSPSKKGIHCQMLVLDSPQLTLMRILFIQDYVAFQICKMSILQFNEHISLLLYMGFILYQKKFQDFTRFYNSVKNSPRFYKIL
jgi:hypothetical protein